MPFFTTPDGCKLFYEIRTKDPANPDLIFLNGFTQTTVYWYGQVPAFSERFSILLYDARGQGQSDLGDNRPSLKQHVIDLGELLTHLKINMTHLMGLSHGARVALGFAAARPEVVGKLVLCGLGSRDSRKTSRIVDTWYEILKDGDIAAMAEIILPSVFGETFLQKHKGIMPDIAAAVVERNQKQSLLAQLKALREYPAPETLNVKKSIRSLVITGANDPLILPDEAAELAGHLKAGYQEVEDAGHSIPVEAPKEFARLVLAFLDAL